MQSSFANDRKVYNLSEGPSLPEWISGLRRRKLEKKNTELRRRIEVIQDFEMPDVSGCIQQTSNDQYILVTGTYKPRVRCYEVRNLALKFERCLDAEVIKMLCLTDGYEKLVFLEEDRWLEFHSKQGFHYRTRIPTFGRDMVYHPMSCDLCIVGSGPDVYRLNLEQGRHMTPLTTNSRSLTACDVNRIHGMIIVGTAEGHVEAWDFREKRRIGDLNLDNASISNSSMSPSASVSCLRFKNDLNFAVGTSGGQVRMYDLRSRKPLLVRDHRYGLPIKTVKFANSLDDERSVLSLDSRTLKIWDENTGEPFISVEPGVGLNDFCMIPGSGLLLFANEAPKMLSYFIPSLGPAPKWCSFLDNITEELEETDLPNVYDDYKFITEKELELFGLSHLIGTNILRAYMHGYFIDARLYDKAKQSSHTFAYENYVKQKIQAKMDESRPNRISNAEVKLPSVNRDLAERLLGDRALSGAGKKSVASVIFKDSRFDALFEDPEFAVDPDSMEFRLLNPALSKLSKTTRKKKQKKPDDAVVDSSNTVNYPESEAVSSVAAQKTKRLNRPRKQIEDMRPSTSRRDDASEEESSSDEDREFHRDLKVTHKQLQAESKLRKRFESQMKLVANGSNASDAEPKNNLPTRRFVVEEADDGEDLFDARNSRLKQSADVKKLTLAQRLALEEQSEADGAVEVTHSGAGSREITFNLKKKPKALQRQQKQEEHVRERRQVRRSASGISSAKKRGKFANFRKR